MSDPIVNGYDDDDLNTVVSNIEELEAEIKSVMATAMNTCRSLRNKIKVAKQEAAGDLNIPRKPLNAILKLRRKQREMDAIVADVPDEYGEMLESMHEALGDFAGTPLGEAALGSIKRRGGEPEETDDFDDNGEQAEGEEVLSRRRKGN